jgi:hypothetical protein
MFRDDLIMAAIEHEISAPSHVYTLYRAGNPSLDLFSPTAKDHALSFSHSALAGALFDGPTGCCTSAKLAGAKKSTFYAFDLPLDDRHRDGFYTRDFVYLPPLRMSSRIVETGEYLHARLRVARQHGMERTLTGFANIYMDFDGAWQNEFTYQPRIDRDTALNFLLDYMMALNPAAWSSYLRWSVDASARLCTIQ